MSFSECFTDIDHFEKYRYDNYYIFVKNIHLRGNYYYC